MPAASPSSNGLTSLAPRSRPTVSMSRSSTSPTPSAASSCTRAASAPPSSWRVSVTLLALDTSTSWASVALYDGSAVLAEETWYAQRRHGDELFPTIERLLARTRTTLAGVDRIAVATGPGSFTGLRVAIAAAQGLARGAGASLAGVSTLDVLAYPHAPGKQRTCALLPAGRTEWYAAIYQERNRKWMRRSPYIVATLPDLCRQIGTRTLFVGEID